MPQARREHGLRAIERAHKALHARAAAGADPRRDLGENALRSDAIAHAHQRNHAWRPEPGVADDDEAFRREVAPKLGTFPLRAIARVTGLSPSACSRIRAGTQTPHPRHWEALRALVEGDDAERQR